MFIFFAVISFPLPCRWLIFTQLSILNLGKWLQRGSRVWPVSIEEWFLTNGCWILLLSINLELIWDAIYQTLCEASVLPYSAFPRHPRRLVLLSAGLVRLNAGTVELFIFCSAFLLFCIVAKASAPSYLLFVMTALLLIKQRHLSILVLVGVPFTSMTIETIIFL